LIQFYPFSSLTAREEGRKGLYGGMGAHLMKVVPNAAILFYVYELTENFYLTRHARKIEVE
jgi:hypothetical protein